MNKIELAKIPVNGLKLNECLTFDESYYQNTDILELKNMEITGEIRKNQEQDIFIEATVTGIMVLPDARTLEPIELPLKIEIAEKLDETNETIQEYFEKSKNTLDIMGILWENIVLEVPISITKGTIETTEGNGWELVEEKKESIDPRLAPLRKLLDSEKE